MQNLKNIGPSISGRYLSIIILFVLINFSALRASGQRFSVTLKPNGASVMTPLIQRAIDSCASMGGGIVNFLQGKYLSGGIQLKSNVTLQFKSGAILQGSDKYADYANDAFIFGKNLSNIEIIGKGIIDGVDCYNPEGEEGFRGPHAIRLINCKNINLEGFTIINSANWAINCRNCSDATVKNVKIFGGHDGLHTRFCSNFIITGCDFRTGDDAFAGNDNRNFQVSHCKINSSCNGFRLGCYNFTLKQSKIWGPGEYKHKIQNRNNMLSAFTHFSPDNKKSKLQSGNWLIQDVTIDSVDNVYRYNFKDGLWQTGQPVTSIRFEKTIATNILCAFNIIGDKKRKFNLSISESSFDFREDTRYENSIYEGIEQTSNALFFATQFDKIALNDVRLKNIKDSTLMVCKDGNKIMLNKVVLTNKPGTEPSGFQNIKNISETEKF
ncbi:MAG: glycosyl hydrolase family 28 protein [Bacteroidales bacterium]|nr:glycosyl hydrolase family 28 protein [Bacteroidales bacterium]